MRHKTFALFIKKHDVSNNIDLVCKNHKIKREKMSAFLVAISFINVGKKGAFSVEKG